MCGLKMNKKSRLAAVLFLFFCASVSVSAEEYKSYGRRDPFVPLVGLSRETSAKGVLGILTVDDVILQGIAVNSDGTNSVIINGELMRKGERIGRVSVESISDNVVEIKIDDENHRLRLYE